MAEKVLLIGKSGSGKALVDTEPVATPNGWVKIGDIKEGDIVFDENGKQTKVLKTHKYIETVYRVHFKDGTYIDTCKDHRWKILASSHDGVDKEFILTTSEVKEKIDERKSNNVKYHKYAIPRTRPVEYDKKELIIPPYVLGALLGDGCFRDKHMYFSNVETDIINNVNKLVKEKYGNIEFVKNPASQCQHVLKYNNEEDVSLGRGGHIRKQLIVDIESLGLCCKKSHNKFIPEIYLRSSVEDRIELLKGLFDTDGHINGVRKSLTSTSYELILGIQELANSLGIETRISKDTREYKKYKSGVCYSITFLTHKKIWTSEKHSQKYAIGEANKKSNRVVRDDRTFITHIEILNKQEHMTCLEVESDCHTFLTKGYKVTHNSTSLRNLDKESTAILKCVNKKLPFKKGDKDFTSMYISDVPTLLNTIAKLVKMPKYKTIIVDDLFYISSYENFRRVAEKGYTKFTDIAKNMFDILTIPDMIQRDDLTFIFITHSDTNPNTLETDVKTIGKMIDSQLGIAGLFTMVLEATVIDGEYKFLTHNISGNSVVKTPMGMFEDDYIDNDLQIVLNAMKEYYLYRVGEIPTQIKKIKKFTLQNIKNVI